MYEEDEHHVTAARGLRLLAAGHAELLIPVPVVFEVYKRLNYDVGPALAHAGLQTMRSSLSILYIASHELDELQRIVLSMPWWGGSLEDASLAMIGLSREVPVWTFNYRDFRAFRNLQFWSPG